MSTTANYENILELGRKEIQTVAKARPSGMLEFEELRRLWLPFEQECSRKNYDVFAAWYSVDELAKRVRQTLMWWSGMSSAEGRDLPTFGGPDAFVALNNSLERLVALDSEVLREKNTTYGESWKRRGGIGAFMMLARKYDRIDNILKEFTGSTLMRQLRNNPGQVQDDVDDLRRYLLLVEDEMEQRGALAALAAANGSEAAKAYINQDPN